MTSRARRSTRASASQGRGHDDDQDQVVSVDDSSSGSGLVSDMPLGDLLDAVGSRVRQEMEAYSAQPQLPSASIGMCICLTLCFTLQSLLGRF